VGKNIKTGPRKDLRQQVSHCLYALPCFAAYLYWKVQLSSM